MDDNGIPKTWERITGARYRPGYIAWYGLVNLEHYLRHGDHRYLTIFLNQVDWLEEHATTRGGAVVWATDFDYPVGATTLRAPWVQLMTKDWRLVP